MKEVSIKIIDMRTPKWWRVFLTMTFSVFGPIALGMIAGSPAMQWAGFVVGVLIMLAAAVSFSKDDRSFDVSEIDRAKAYLDSLSSLSKEGGEE